jgi:hypothetical protein
VTKAPVPSPERRGRVPPQGPTGDDTRRSHMYIGLGTLVILIILAIIIF